MPKSKLTSSINIFLILFFNLTLHGCESLRFELLSGSTKCISEEIKHDSMTVGRYVVINPIGAKHVPDTHRISTRVTSPRGNNYHSGDFVESGTFAFTAPDTGDYITCFWAPYRNPPSKISIEFNWKTGIDAKDWYNVARKGQFQLLDTELRKLYDSAKSIHDEMFYLREREEEMQVLNKSTKSKMAVFSFVSILLVMSVVVLQIWHLKAYFERKKLL